MKISTVATGLVLLVGACMWADGSRASPTTEDRRATQEMINRGDPARTDYVNELHEFLHAYDAWDKSRSEADRQKALARLDSLEAAEARLKANRDSVIAKVDSTFDTQEPPGTDVQYDPECTDYGYTSSRCFVRICEPSFESPDDVATTKIHEFEHVRQKQAGRWGPGNVPQSCTYEFHRLEYEAYEAELDADFGKRTSLTIEVKLDILNRKAEHLAGMLNSVGVRLGGDKIRRTLPGTDVVADVTVTNDSESARMVEGAFENPQGWMMLPPGFSCFLEAERETTFTLLVHVPEGVVVGTANEVLCHALSSDGSEATDILFIHAIPVVDVRSGPSVEGQPGTWTDVRFTVVNEGTGPDEVAANVTSVLGWPLEQSDWLVPLGPGASADLQTRVLIPPGAPHTTDLLLCMASSLGGSGQSDAGWLYAEVMEGTTDVDRRQGLVLALMPNVPNPFVSGTSLRFVLPVGGPVELGVYDVAGRRVRVLMSADEGAVAPGAHTIRWDGRDDHGARVASGVYFARLRACDRGVVRKMVVLE